MNYKYEPDADLFIKECEQAYHPDIMKNPNCGPARLTRLVKRYREALNQVVIDSMQDESITRCALKMRSTAANALQYDGLDGSGE